MFARAFDCSLPWARWMQFIPPLTVSLRSILILSSTLHIGLPSSLFPSDPPKGYIYYSFSSSCVLHTLLIPPFALTFVAYFTYCKKKDAYEITLLSACPSFCLWFPPSLIIVRKFKRSPCFLYVRVSVCPPLLFSFSIRSVSYQKKVGD
jgi:hypothetical protein